MKKWFKGMMAAALFAVGSFAALPTYAAEGDIVAGQVSMPQGVDLTSLIQSGVVVLAGVVAIAIAAWCSWLLVRKGIRWIRNAF